MKKEAIDRRDLLKAMGTGIAALGTGLVAPTFVARTANGELVQSEDEYGGYTVERMTTLNDAYQMDSKVLQPMSEKRTVFSRNEWDPLRENRPEVTENLIRDRLVEGNGKVPDQTRLDYAFTNAAWALANMYETEQQYRWTPQSGQVRQIGGFGLEPWNPEDLDMSWDDVQVAVKHAALFYGASLVGVAELNPLWLYSDHFFRSGEHHKRTIPVLQDGDRYEQTEDAWYIPASMNRVIALAFEEDYHAIANSPGRLASAGVGNGYSRMAITAFFLAEFLRGLGYRALPAGNGVGLSIPIAIDAGLGELGRLGLLITPKYGPRVRLAKVITDMPLTTDVPIRFGVREFCEVCKLCATDCPSGAVTEGPRTWEGKSRSNNPGVLKWYAEGEKCYDFNGFSCSNCKRVCPFNKPNNSWLHRLTRTIIEGGSGAANSMMVKLDQASGYGSQRENSKFWEMEGSKSITAREKM
jgi:reductive dehalogenase